MGSIKQRTWVAAIAVVFMIWVLMPVISLACSIEYQAPQGSGTRYVSFETGETSRTITAAAEVVRYELYNYCTLTKSIGSCTGGCCLGMCGPVSLKVCTDGFLYSAFCPSGQSCNYSSAPPIPWDVVCAAECTYDNDCDDGIFCNGTEMCLDGECVTGLSPCNADEQCDETMDQCVECQDDNDCDDGAFCNGAEMCVEGACVEGAASCPNQFCNEGAADVQETEPVKSTRYWRPERAGLQPEILHRS